MNNRLEKKSDKTAKMKMALKKTVVPELRKIGFTGSFPHFRRIASEKIDLLTFQFGLRDLPAFVIEIAQASKDGIITSWGKHIPPEKTRAWDLNNRFRLRENLNSIDDPWFYYEVDPIIHNRTLEGVEDFFKRNPAFVQNKQKAIESLNFSLKDKELLEKLGEKVYDFRANQVLTLLQIAERLWSDPAELKKYTH